MEEAEKESIEETSEQRLKRQLDPGSLQDDNDVKNRQKQQQNIATQK